MPIPIDFLTPTERNRLNHFLEPIPDEDLRVLFTLSDRDTGVQQGVPVVWHTTSSSLAPI